MPVKALLRLSRAYQRKLELIAARHEMSLDEPGSTVRAVELCIRAAACETPLCPDCGAFLCAHPTAAWWCEGCGLTCTREGE